MIIVQPSKDTFWRTVFFISTVLPWLSAWQSITLARRMEIEFTSSTSWMGLLVVLFVLGIFPLLAWTLTWSRYSERILPLSEFPERIGKNIRWIGWVALIISLVGYTVVFTVPFIQKLFSGEEWVRLLTFWYFSLIGMIAVKILWPDRTWFASLVSVVLIQTVFHLLVANYSYVTNYPFAMGWSETSRYYHPSFFLSEFVYGKQYPLPIINPSLHLVLALPYLFDAPLWMHRFWHVSARVLFLGVTSLILVNRIATRNVNGRLLVVIWVFLYLLVGPLYFHLTIPVILVLFGYSSHNDRRNWLVLFLASAWSGWSRVNWYPVPAMLMAVLYVLKTPYKGKKVFQYLWKPALWGILGMVTAFAFQRIYIAISGVENSNYFYTSLVSDLLWYRLFPSATFPTGILPTAIMVSFPIWLVIYWVLRTRKDNIHPLRLLLLFMAVSALFISGMLVSLKIGGGADLHNMDAYFLVILIVAGYFVFARFHREDGELDQPLSLHWVVVILLIAIPVWSQVKSNVGIKTYDSSRTDAVLSDLQEGVDQVNSQGGEILFITQRHLISMGMLQNVTIIPEYEREDLMEMAMGNNSEYLGKFRADMENQRFSLIVVDVLKFQYLGPERSFGEENNVWVRRIMKPILCNYRLDTVFPEDDIALYVPQTGARQCP